MTNFSRALLFLCFLYGNLVAESCCPWYWRAGAGVNFLKDNVPHYDFTFHPGIVLSGGVGYEFFGYYLDGFVLELETAYRWNHIAKIKNNGYLTQIHGHIQSVALLANSIYKFPWRYPIKPFFGLGVGWGYEHISFRGPYLSGLHSHHSQAVVQLLGGLSFLYGNCSEWSLHYTYLNFDPNVWAHSFLFSLMYHF